MIRVERAGTDGGVANSGRHESSEFPCGLPAPGNLGTRWSV
jgi:hypothetical protein